MQPALWWCVFTPLIVLALSLGGVACDWVRDRVLDWFFPQQWLVKGTISYENKDWQVVTRLVHASDPVMAARRAIQELEALDYDVYGAIAMLNLAVGSPSPPQVEQRFKNYYRCLTCSYEWTDIWSARCDDDCPACGARHISPYESDDLPQPHAEIDTDVESELR